MYEHTNEWKDYAIGYHKFGIPPGFSPKAPRGVIDFNVLQVVPSYSGTLDEYIRSLREFGGIVQSVEVNGWRVVTINERQMDDLVSSESYVVVGVQRVGNDLIVSKQKVSKSIVGSTGITDEMLVFFQTTKTIPNSSKVASSGFALQNYQFIGTPKGYVEDAEVVFAVDKENLFDVQLNYGPLNPYVQLRTRDGGSLLSSLALNINFGTFKIGERSFEFARMVDGSENTVYYNLATPGVSNDYRNPEMTIDYANSLNSPNEAEEILKAFLSTIQPL